MIIPLCKCGHGQRFHFEEPMFMRGWEICWFKLDGRKLCGCEKYEPVEEAVKT